MSKVLTGMAARSILSAFTPCRGGKPLSSVYLVGFHGAHCESLHDSLSDVVVLIRRKPRLSQLLILADWNVDLLPTLSDDPFAGFPCREDHHRDRRLILDTFCSAFGLFTVIPARVESPCGGPFGEQSISTPFTRIPVGETACYALPSLLDYFAVTSNIILDSWIDWCMAYSDHALTFASVKGNPKQSRPLRGHWRCSDWFSCLDWMHTHAHAVKSLRTADTCTSFFLNAQENLADTRTCSQRRHARVPDHIRALFARASLTNTECERQRLKKTAAEGLRQHRIAVEAEQARYIVRYGRVF